MIYQVVLSKDAQKALRYVPKHVTIKFLAWVTAVERLGLEEVRKQPGYHDEPLKGRLIGQRSIRLSRAYRAIYSIKNEHIEFAYIEEVNKHDY